MSSLLVTAGPQQGRRYMLREKTRMGRATDNEIVLADHLVSRHHAEIVRQELHFTIHDLGSKNGLLVNGSAAADRRLYRGDQLQVGKTVFLFETPRDVRPARYSDVTVYLEAELDSSMMIQAPAETAPLPLEASQPGLMAIIERTANLLDGAQDEIGDAVTRLLKSLMENFDATHGALLLRASNGEAVPLSAVAPDTDLRLSAEAARMGLNEGRSVLTTALVSVGDGIDQRARRAMLAPLSRKDSVLGAVYLARPEGPDFTLEQLAWLRLLARMAAGAMHCAMQRDQFVISSAVANEQYVGDSPQAQAVREQIHKIANSDSTVLLTGETGTGKELASCAIHVASARSSAPFVVIDCSAIPDALLESELFGHEAGAFTGADRLKRGKLEMAEGGTVFLDEIGELQVELQPKLLRFLENRTFYRVGGVRPISTDVRIIAATNRRLDQAVTEGRFRQDLMFRLNVMQLKLPSLRERREDVRLLLEYFAPTLAARLGKPYLGVVEEAWPWLDHYTWPGNVRELRHSLERALIMSDDGLLRLEHFQLPTLETSAEPATDSARSNASAEQTHPSLAVAGYLPMSLAESEKETILRAMRFAGGNRVRAAEILEIHRNTLAKKIQEYGIQVG